MGNTIVYCVLVGIGAGIIGEGFVERLGYVAYASGILAGVNHLLEGGW